MRICYFGIYNPEYSRNKILISGLKMNGVDVIECRSDKKGISKYFDLISKHWKIRKDYDVMVVGYPGFQPVILARFLTRKPIIFDAFLSMYDSVVLDRKQISENSLKAKYFWWLDKISMSIADMVIIDTNEHKKYISEEFKICGDKIERVYIGADIDIFYPEKGDKDDNVFRVLFFGTYIPLQGIEYIIKAAKLLEREKDIRFEIIGKGQEKEKILKLSKELKNTNINFSDAVPQSQLRSKISSSDVCLGIFGNTEKTKRVIPNKVYECVATGKPVITADTPAERELFNDSELIFTEIADGNAIAQAILSIKSQPKLALKVAEKGYSKFIKEAAPKILGLKLKKVAEKLYEKRNR